MSNDVSVGFKIFGDATGFERAIAKSYDSTKQLDQKLKGLGKIGQFAGAAAGGFGVVKFFSDAITKAQQLRDASIENGTAIDKSVAALARYGDTIDKIKAGAAELGAKLLGGLSSTGEAIGDKVAVFLRGKEQVANGDRAQQGADVAEERIKQLKEIQAERADTAKARADDYGKINILLAEQLKLYEKINSGKASGVEQVKIEREIQRKGTEIATINKKIVDETRDAQKALDDAKAEGNAKNVSDLQEIKNLKAQALDLDVKATFEARNQIESIKLATEAQKKRNEAKSKEIELAKKNVEAQKQINEAQHNVDKAKDKLDQAVGDRSKLSLQELANIGQFSTGTSIKTTDDAKKAREALDLEQQANQKRLSGDVEGAASLFGQADKVRESLGGSVKSSDAEVFRDLKENLKEQITKLDELKAAFEGKFVAQ